MPRESGENAAKPPALPQRPACPPAELLLGIGFVTPLQPLAVKLSTLILIIIRTIGIGRLLRHNDRRSGNGSGALADLPCTVVLLHFSRCQFFKG